MEGLAAVALAGLGRKGLLPPPGTRAGGSGMQPLPVCQLHAGKVEQELGLHCRGGAADGL